MPIGNASSSSQIGVHALNLLAARDFESLRNLLAPDVKLDWPYHQSGVPVLIEGADAFIEAASVIKVFKDLEIRQIKVNELSDSGITIIEARSTGTYANGRTSYTNHYIFLLKIVEGKVTLWREFYNPLEVMKVSGGARGEKKATASA